MDGAFQNPERASLTGSQYDRKHNRLLSGMPYKSSRKHLKALATPCRKNVQVATKHLKFEMAADRSTIHVSHVIKLKTQHWQKPVCSAPCQADAIQEIA